jgi:hypothetical protein
LTTLAEMLTAKWERVTEIKRGMRPLVLRLMGGTPQAGDAEEFNRLRLELLALDSSAIMLGPYPWDENPSSLILPRT